MKTFFLILCVSLGAYFTSAKRVEVQDPNELPYYAQLFFEEKFECSAVVISPNFLLSSATCANDDEVEGYSVIVGSIKKNVGEKRYKVEKFILSPNYRFRRNNDYLSLIKLTSNIENAMPAQLATKLPRDAEETNVKIFGFANEFDKKVKVPVLLSNNGTVLNYTDCYQELRLDGRYMRSDKFCIITDDDFEYMEAGAPALVEDKLFAISIKEIGWASTHIHSIPISYINIFHYRDWIIQTAGLDKSYFPKINRRAVELQDSSFYAQLLLKNEFHCSATVISSTSLLTTAACTKGSPQDYEVLVGTVEKAQGGKRYKVDKFLVYVTLPDSYLQYTLALIKLKSPMGDEAKPLPLAAKTSSPVGNENTAKIFGFAAKGDQTQDNNVLLSDDVVIEDQATCEKYSGYDERYVGDDISCVMTFDRYPCMEQGSPLLYKGTLFAIFGTGVGMNMRCQPTLEDFPLSYINIEQYKNWIMVNLN